MRKAIYDIRHTIYRRSIFKTTFLVLVAVIVLVGCSRGVTPADISVNAESAMIIEAKSGKVLLEKNADKRLQPASTVKIMTAIVAIEKFPLDGEITPTGSIEGIEPTVIDLEPGAQYRLKDLIAAILIKSANDAAITIAEGVSDSEEAFVKLMNLKARKIGMKDTSFTSSSGLPADNREDQYTTARDMVKMMRYALRHKLILEMMSQTGFDIYSSDNERIHLNTHNKSLFSGEDMSWGKTGYTVKAGRTFVGVDPSYRPRIVFALLKSGDLWNDIAVLKKNGLEIYKKQRRNIFTRVIDWIRGKG